MQERQIFAYQAGSDPVRTFDARFKLPLLLFFLTGAAFASLPWYPLLVLVTGFILGIARLSPLSLFLESRVFLLLAGVIFLSRWFSDTLLRGALGALRFLLIVTAARIMVETSKSSDIARAVHSYLSPLNSRLAGRFSLQIMMALRFIPLIFETMEEIKAARKSRAVELNRNPLVRIKSLAIPLLSLLLQRSDEIADALSSRGLGSRGWVHPPQKALKKKEWLTTFLLSLLFLSPALVRLL